MPKYSKSLIDRYLLGEEVKDVNFDELENDLDFIIAAIEQSDDKKMAFHAGENVKKDINFVKYIMNEYGEDVEFVEQIVSDYKKIHEEQDDFCDIFEVNILLEKFYFNLGKERSDEFIKYRITNHATAIRLFINLEEVKFINVEHIFIGYDGIINYMAKVQLEDYFDKELYPLEETLHERLSSKENISPRKMVNTLLSIIKSYDDILYWYVARHIELLDDLKERVSDYYKRWDAVFKNNVEKNEGFLREKIGELLDSNYELVSYETDHLTNYIIKLFKEKYCSNPELREVLTYDSEDVETMKYYLGDNISLIDQRNINIGLEIAKKIFIEGDVYPDLAPLLNNDNDKKEGTIIDINKARTTKK